jgi:hypothetical protein
MDSSDSPNAQDVADARSSADGYAARDAGRPDESASQADVGLADVGSSQPEVISSQPDEVARQPGRDASQAELGTKVLDVAPPDRLADAPEDAARSLDAVLAEVAPALDSSLPIDTTPSPMDALSCTTEQAARRNQTTTRTLIPYRELPTLVQDFLTAFLSVEYATEHFLFYTATGAPPGPTTVLYFYFVDGCFTTTYGQLQWGPAIYQGEIRYIGPSREARILIGETEAKARMEEAGCDASNLDLTWSRDYGLKTTNPLPNEQSGLIWYPAWQAGRQNVPPTNPLDLECFADQCTMNAETGAMTVIPGGCTRFAS